jgi:hypothetical protein
MADTSASCSIPCTTTGFLLLTLMQSIRISKQSETRAGVKSASVGIVTRNLSVDRRIPVSNDV